ncbi:hypothetical protein GCM10010269_58080 [Streptomyces humidus]|uniref:Uncharacterized protein n=1 Tax=Streptomyces humidus TaxID=52259 RepID=A0A918G1N7_9ACTN|nr:hypothetical protein [Streptomyces humidus]GGS11370.1 hypothetical protein GCM10010269_58080 [Streptomyces humidus]
MNTDRARGPRLGDAAPPSHPPVPPPGTHHSPTQTVTAGDNNKITQKNTSLKFSIPVVGPLLSLAYGHPLVAGLMAVVLVGGGGAAVSAALPDSTPSPSTSLVRGFVMQRSDGQKAAVGYDFTHSPPVVADSGTDALYVQSGFLMSTDGKLAEWSTSEVPTAEGCRKAVSEHPTREASVAVTYVMCYLDRNGDPGYISITGTDDKSVTIDTAHLG